MHQAKGFPPIRVSLEKTDNASARGTGGSSGMGKVRWEVIAPLRKLTCHSEDAEDHQGITKCWKEAVAKDAEFPSGDINFMVTFAPGGDAKSTSVSRTFNYPKHEPLTDCVKKLFFGVQPRPKDADVRVQWYLRFKLY